MHSTPPDYSKAFNLLNQWQSKVMQPKSLTIVGDTLYFVSTHPAHGEELWHVTMGEQNSWPSIPTIELVKDIVPTTAIGQ